MAEVVCQGQGLAQVLVEAERSAERTGDLDHFQRMGEARAIVVALVEHEHLGLVLEPAEGGRMDDAVAIAPERVAAGALRLVMEAPPRGLWVGRVCGACSAGVDRHESAAR